MDEKRLERIEVKLDDISDHLSSIDKTLVEQHLSLKEHVRRTALLEKEVSPIKKHVNMVQGALLLITILSALAGIIECLRMIK